MSNFSSQLASQKAAMPPALEKKFAEASRHDVSGVRVHTGNKYQAGSGMGAAAYTTGQQIMFQEARYQPRNAAGQKLIGHELAHVMQQGAAAKQ